MSLWKFLVYHLSAGFIPKTHKGYSIPSSSYLNRPHTRLVTAAYFTSLHYQVSSTSHLHFPLSMCVPKLPSGSEDVLFLFPRTVFSNSLLHYNSLLWNCNLTSTTAAQLKCLFLKVANDLITKSNSQFCLLTALIFDAVDHSFSWNTSARLGLPLS